MKVLVVDDEIVSRKSLEMFTKKFGYEVLSASGGEEAWEIWEQERPQMVITDWVMPSMNGLELCSAIREKEGDDYTYVVMVTGQDDAQRIIETLKAGADDYIFKPFDKNELFFRLKTGDRVVNLHTRDSVIFTLARLAESRDIYTGNHLERIRYFCKILTETIYKEPAPPFELNRQFITNIFLTSPLHDIGNIGIPEHILLKPARLDDKELAVMKKHTIIGYDTLHEVLQKNPNSDYLRMSSDIIRYHHEKIDGTGYPEGLKGEKIPLAARIVALADVYDALTTARAYRKAYSHEEAISIIKNEENRHFDSLVVKAFLKCSEHFAEIKEKFKPVHVR